ncbi:probable transcription factor PosF21 [Primulina huaijiensis]|uniref:probable transcription factor PosF21 n=1 Tax=Primulina huaijiensis TaxID=1492673 RepID=UPI003CC6F833
MDKEKSHHSSECLLPPSGRYSAFSPSGSLYNVKSEVPGSSKLPPFGPDGHFGHGALSDSSRFSHDISRMLDNPPKKLGHRRAHSEILTLPDDISFDSDLGVVDGFGGPSFSDDTEEDLLSIYLGMDNFNSPSVTSEYQVGEASASIVTESHVRLALALSGSMSADIMATGLNDKPRIRHQHSQSMDGSATIKSEMLMSGLEDLTSAESKKALSAAKLAELALIDPKRAKRIWANRQSAARSKERKMRYIGELEREVQTLQTEATSLSAQLTLLQRDTNGLTAENGELKLRLQTSEQQVHLQDALNDALKEEIQHLKMLTGQTILNGGAKMNIPASYGANQQYYPNNHVANTLLTAQQLQQLQIQQGQKQPHLTQQVQPSMQHEQQQLRNSAPSSLYKFLAPNALSKD